nr:hypothetical protein [Tanacetum cinerariifolium]
MGSRERCLDAWVWVRTKGRNFAYISPPRSPATHPDEGTRTSQLLPEGTLTDPKDSERNIQLTDRGLPSTTITDQSSADTKYHVDKTYSTRFKDDLKELSDEEMYKVGDEMEDEFPLNNENNLFAKWVESPASIAWSVGPRLTKIENTLAIIQIDLATLKTNTPDIKSMVTEIFYAFKG